MLASRMVYATISCMHRRMSVILTLISLAAVGLLLLARLQHVGVAAQEQSAVDVWRELVNDTRLNEGLDPYGQSRLLAQAAQRHADDIAENGFADPDNVHIGSDDSDAPERIDEAGYAAWTEDGGELVVAENVWSGSGDPSEALAAFLQDATFRANLLSDRFREVGVGVASAPDGSWIYVLDFGARPNVLPIFINDGAATTENREVALRLTNERVRPEGEGAIFIGEAVEIRISDEPSFEQLSWQPWAQLVSWTLPDFAGEHTVYVQFRDAAGRTAASADGILLDQGTGISPTVGPQTATSMTPSEAIEPTTEPTSDAGGPSEVVTLEGPAGEAATPSAGTPMPGPTASGVPSGELSSRPTPFPTWTPLPSPEPISTEADGDPESALALPALGDYGRPLAIVGVLQGVVILLGLYWLVRHGSGV